MPEQRAVIRDQDTVARHEARENLTPEQRAVVRVQDTAARQEQRQEAYTQRTFEDQFQLDAEAALQKFCSMSGLQHMYQAKFRPEEFAAGIEAQLRDSRATKERLVKEWNAAMVHKPNEPIKGCASCGRAKRKTVEVPIDSLEVFLLSEVQRHDYLAIQEDYRKAFTVYRHSDGCLYFLHSRLYFREWICHTVQAMQSVCFSNCSTAVLRGKRIRLWRSGWH